MKKQNPKTSLIIYFSFIMIFLKKVQYKYKMEKKKDFFFVGKEKKKT